MLSKKTVGHKNTASLCNHIRERIKCSGSIDQPIVSSSSKKMYLILGVIALLLLFIVPPLLKMVSQTNEICSSYKEENQDIDTNYYALTEKEAQTLCQINKEHPRQEQPPRMTNHRIWILSVCMLVGSAVFLIARRKKKNIKLSSDVDADISIDGLHVAKIKAGGVYATSLRKGEYLIDFSSTNGEHYRVVQKVSDRNMHVVMAEFLAKQEIKFRCFIAGSLSLSAERNALIAVVSKMYNRWESEHFRISSHTYEDFNRDVVPGGQQMLYDAFIENETDWCVFILLDGIGNETLGEYKVAMNSLHKNGHPKILILASPEWAKVEALSDIKKEIIDADQYWNTCNNIEHMQSIFRECVEWEITLLSKSRRKY